VLASASSRALASGVNAKRVVLTIRPSCSQTSHTSLERILRSSRPRSLYILNSKSRELPAHAKTEGSEMKRTASGRR
jgi:hypothetical protein